MSEKVAATVIGDVEHPTLHAYAKLGRDKHSDYIMFAPADWIEEECSKKLAGQMHIVIPGTLEQRGYESWLEMVRHLCVLATPIQHDPTTCSCDFCRLVRGVRLGLPKVNE